MTSRNRQRPPNRSRADRKSDGQAVSLGLYVLRDGPPSRRPGWFTEPPQARCWATGTKRQGSTACMAPTAPTVRT
jgi:hypothetical protein